MTNTRNFKVVLLPGGFYMAPLDNAAGREADASVRAREGLIRTIGLTKGALPGLTEAEARALAHRLTKARVRTAARGRKRA